VIEKRPVRRFQKIEVGNIFYSEGPPFYFKASLFSDNVAQKQEKGMQVIVAKMRPRREHCLTVGATKHFEYWTSQGLYV